MDPKEASHMIAPDELITVSDPLELAARLREAETLLLLGEPGSGKSTLMQRLAVRLHAEGRACQGIAADPGSPAFGVPGALALGRWMGEHWEREALAALCTLDAGRFRLPLVQALRSLIEQRGKAVLIVDAPGLVRGVAAAELLDGLFGVLRPQHVLVISRSWPPPLHSELCAIPAFVYWAHPAAAARHLGRDTRATRRTALWDTYLAAAELQSVSLDEVSILGTPPPRSVPSAWNGRQVALMRQGETLAMGEVERLQDPHLQIRAASRGRVDALMLRDAGRAADGCLRTCRRPEPAAPRVRQRALQIGPAQAELVNGPFGDPLVHLRLPQQRRSLLFDLGEGQRLSAAIAHQVGDVFISHAHIDHIGGFLWLLRTRIGPYSPCRLYGPPGLAGHVEGLLRGVLWDRIGENAPVFEISELHGRRLRRFRAQAGAACVFQGERSLSGDVILQEPTFCVRARALDHLGTPSIAYAYEPAVRLNVRAERLAASGLPPGAWLGRLRRAVLKGEHGLMQLPDGRERAVDELADALLHSEPGKKLGYATDLADTAENRRQLTALAEDAELLICEASFREQDVAQARRTGHLTARACGEIAAVAGARRLLPFHFSRRYENDLPQLLAEVRTGCPSVTLEST
jgi:ribonuclease Z